jgi:hypothetical protein
MTALFIAPRWKVDHAAYGGNFYGYPIAVNGTPNLPQPEYVYIPIWIDNGE